MNVLLTAAGRRSYLVRYFREALRGGGIVVAANSDGATPAMWLADAAEVVPPSHHPEYVERIASLCRRYDVGLLCSCHDLDVLALAPHRTRLAEQGVAAMLPDADWARAALDKVEIGRRLAAAGFDVPWTGLSTAAARSALERGEIRFPLLVKARSGFGSLALHRCDDLDALQRFYELACVETRDGVANRFLSFAGGESVLIQEWIDGPELCAVVVNDFEGVYAAHFVSEIHVMRAGESESATTREAEALGDLPARLSRLIRHPGVCGVDLIASGGRFRILDVNLRFTGDYPFHHLAGADVPAALLAWAAGRPPDPDWLRARPGVLGFKDLVPVGLP